jgi:MFS family permease
MTATTPRAGSPFADPTRRVGAGWIALFATAWLGIWMAQLTPIKLLLPQQVENVVQGRLWTDNILAFGIISGIAGACALVTYPLAGAFSDRMTSRRGRRRPLIVFGVLIFATSLALLSLQTTIIGVGVFWSTSIVGFCISSAAITATLSDQVPVNQRGFVSGWISTSQAVGTILGILLVTTLWASAAAEQAFGYPLVAILLVVLVIPCVIVMPDQELTKGQRPGGGLRGMLQSIWVNPVKHPDFFRTMIGRVLVNLGNALGITLLLYFLQYGLQESTSDARSDLLILTAIYLVFFVLAALIFGRLSDHVGRRKVFIYIASCVQALGALILAFVPDINVAFIAAGLFGLGYGCYMSVDQALATQVLRDAHSRAKDLGIMNIAIVVPQAVGPLLGALIVLAFASLATAGAAPTVAIERAGELAGFTGLFVGSGVLAMLGAIVMIPIKSVK